MVYIYPVGGFGNILFQVAAITSFAKDIGVEPALLMVDRIVRDLDADDRILTTHAREYRFLLNRYKQLQYIQRPTMNYPFHYVQPQIKDEHIYKGFFQCEKYFKHNREYILEMFKPTKEIDDIINKYEQYFGHIAIHVRRNDYLRYPHLHPVQSIEYYQKGIEMMPKDKKVLVFSDDIAWCKQNFIGERFIFMGEKDYVEIFIMAKMKYQVISNSSFSWWGAWLSDAEKVVAPKLWFGHAMQYSDKDIIPEHWIKL